MLSTLQRFSFSVACISVATRNNVFVFRPVLASFVLDLICILPLYSSFERRGTGPSRDVAVLQKCDNGEGNNKISKDSLHEYC
jgi:hypothetical protein